MAKVIWKYPVFSPGFFEIIMPEGACILKLALQKDKPFMWVLADSEAKEKRRKFFLVGTGHTLEKTGKYIDTFLMDDDNLVFHLFDITDTG
jgi:hypothetical protein